MIGRKVGDNRYVGALAHGDKLKARKLYNCIIISADALDLGQQGLADVAAEVDGLAGCL